MRSRKLDREIMWRGERFSFNEAGSVRSRKLGIDIDPVAEEVLLQ